MDIGKYFVFLLLICNRKLGSGLLVLHILQFHFHVQLFFKLIPSLFSFGQLKILFYCKDCKNSLIFVLDTIVREAFIYIRTKSNVTYLKHGHDKFEDFCLKMLKIFFDKMSLTCFTICK